MKLNTFFEKFELFADAPNAVQKMRGLVLELAVRGQLVPQDSNDEPADKLLERIREKRRVLAEEGELKDRVQLAPIDRSQEPYPIPNTWLWVRLNELTELVYGKLLPTAELLPEGFQVFGANGIIGHFSKYLYEDEMLLISCRGAYSGTPNISPPKCYVTNNSIVCEFFEPKACDIRFFRAVIAVSPREKIVTGSAQPQVTVANAIKLPVPLPPLTEQKLIVAKVDELMALCDRLEAQQQQRTTQHSMLARATVSRFADAPTPANLDFIFHNAYAITPADLRKTILTLAVQGKLVPQDPNDESAAELASRIAAEKARLVEERVIKPETSLETISDEEVLFQIPDSWTWVRAGELCRPISSGSTPDRSVFRPSEGIPYLKVYNIRNQAVDFEYKPQFIEAGHHAEKMKRSRLFPGDVIMNIVGPPLGKVAIVPNTFPEWNCNQAISFFRPILPELGPYLYTFLKQGSFLENIQLIGTAGQDNISVTKCKYIPIPIPPLAEQPRIVAKVDQLMKLVDQLEQQLEESKSLSERLLDAAVHEVLQAGIAARSSSPLIDRAALACYALKHMQSNPSFARTAEVKVLYLAEAHLGLPLGGQYYREAAGPFDKWVYDFERQADKEGWFKTSKERLSGGHNITRYQLQPAIEAKVEQAVTELGEKRQALDQLLDGFKSLSTEDIEIIATLFAAWNDALIDGQQPTDNWIVREVRENWHPRKQRFSPEKLTTWLSWMRSHDLVPVGRGRRTIYQPGFELID